MEGPRTPPLYTRTFWLISAAHILLGLPILSLAPALSRFVREMGGNEVQIGTLYALGVLSGLLLRPATGWVLDRLGRRWAFLLGGLITTLGFPAFMAVDRLGWLLDAIRFLHGMGMGALFAALFTYAADIAPESRRTEGLAVFGAVGLAAIAIGPSMGMALVDWIGFGGYFLVMGGMSGVGTLLAVWCPETRAEAGHRGGRASDWWYATSHRPLRALWTVCVIWGVAVGAYFAFIEPLCAKYRLGGVAHFFLPYGGAALLLRLLGRQLPDRVGPQRLLLPSLLLHAAGVGVLALARSPQGLWLAGTLAGLGHGYCFPILNALVVNRCDPGRRGVVVTLFTMMVDVGSVFFTPIAGWIAHRWGYPPLFAGCGGALVFSAMLFRLWDPLLLPTPRPGMSTT